MEVHDKYSRAALSLDSLGTCSKAFPFLFQYLDLMNIENLSSSWHLFFHYFTSFVVLGKFFSPF